MIFQTVACISKASSPPTPAPSPAGPVPANASPTASSLAACPWQATTHAAAKCNTSRRSITLAPPRRFQNLHPAIPRTCLAVQRKAAMPQRSYLTPTLENRISRGSTQSRNAPKTPGQLQMTNPNSQWILPRRDAEFAEKKGKMIAFSAPSAALCAKCGLGGFGSVSPTSPVPSFTTAIPSNCGTPQTMCRIRTARTP
jgi:hypothetical protein